MDMDSEESDEYVQMARAWVARTYNQTAPEGVGTLFAAMFCLRQLATLLREVVDRAVRPEWSQGLQSGELEALRTVAEAARAHTSGRGDTLELIEALRGLDEYAPPPPQCNLCGEPCGHRDSASKSVHEMGLVRCTVSGGFESTPGNGSGALDDGTTYTFSLCEFCLDWLFVQMKTPPVVNRYFGGGNGPVFRPAEERVRADDWRTKKKEFFDESARRSRARSWPR